MQNIQSIQQIQPIQKIQRIQTIGGIQPIQKIQPIGDLQQVPSLASKIQSVNNSQASIEEKASAVGTMIANTEDPSQVNSLADVLWTASGQDYQDKLKQWWAYKVDPIRNIFAQHYNKDEDNKQTNNTGWAQLFTNTLVGVAEDMDILANPIKALLPSSWTTAKKYDNLRWASAKTKFKAATTGLDGKRYTFDADTGNIITDFMLEFVSDPLNLLTGGSSGIIKGVAENGLSTTAKQIFKSNNWMDLAKLLIGTDEDEKILTKFIKRMSKNDTLISSFAKGNIDDFRKAFHSFVVNNAPNTDYIKINFHNTKFISSLDDLAIDIFKTAEEDVMSRVSINTMRVMHRVNKLSDYLDKTIMYTATAPVSMPIGATVWFNKRFTPAIYGFVQKNFLNKVIDSGIKGVNTHPQNWLDNAFTIEDSISRLKKIGSIPKKNISEADNKALYIKNAMVEHYVTMDTILFNSKASIEDKVYYMDKFFNSMIKNSENKPNVKVYKNLREYYNDVSKIVNDNIAVAEKLPYGYLDNLLQLVEVDETVRVVSSIKKTALKYKEALSPENINAVMSKVKIDTEQLIVESIFNSSNVNEILNEYTAINISYNAFYEEFKQNLELLGVNSNYAKELIEDLNPELLNKDTETVMGFLRLFTNDSPTLKSLVELKGFLKDKMVPGFYDYIRTLNKGIYDLTKQSSIIADLFKQDDILICLSMLADGDLADEALKLYCGIVDTSLQYYKNLSYMSDADLATFSQITKRNVDKLYSLISTDENVKAYDDIVNKLSDNLTGNWMAPTDIKNIMSNNMLLIDNSDIPKAFAEQFWDEYGTAITNLHDAYMNMNKRISEIGTTEDMVNTFVGMFKADIAERSKYVTNMAVVMDSYLNVATEAETVLSKVSAKGIIDEFKTLDADNSLYEFLEEYFSNKAVYENEFPCLIQLIDMYKLEEGLDQIELSDHFIDDLLEELNLIKQDLNKYSDGGILYDPKGPLFEALEGLKKNTSNANPDVTIQDSDVLKAFNEDFDLRTEVAKQKYDNLKDVKTINSANALKIVDDFQRSLKDAMTQFNHMITNSMDYIRVRKEMLTYMTDMISGLPARGIRTLFKGEDLEFNNVCKVYDNLMGQLACANQTDTIKGFVQHMDKIKALAESLEAEEEFLESAAHLIKDKELATAVLETFMSKRGFGKDLLLTDSYMKRFFENIEMNLQFHSARQKYNLDTFRKDTLPRVIEAMRDNHVNIDKDFKYVRAIEDIYGKDYEHLDVLFESLLNYEHDDPGVDITLSEIIFKAEMPQAYEKYKKADFILYDIETCSRADSLKLVSSDGVGMVSQIGFKKLGDVRYTVYRIDNLKYKQDLSPYTKLVNSKTYLMSDEANLLQQFDLSLNEGKGIMGYNTDVFDTHFMENRVRYLDKERVSEAKKNLVEDPEEYRIRMSKFYEFNQFNNKTNCTQDIYRMRLRANGVKYIKDSDKETIFSLIKSWATNDKLRATMPKLIEYRELVKDAMDYLDSLSDELSTLIRNPSIKKSIAKQDDMVGLVKDDVEHEIIQSLNTYASDSIRILREHFANVLDTLEDYRFEKSAGMDAAEGRVLINVMGLEPEQIIIKDGQQMTMAKWWADKQNTYHRVGKYDVSDRKPLTEEDAMRIFKSDAMTKNATDSLHMHMLFDAFTEPQALRKTCNLNYLGAPVYETTLGTISTFYKYTDRRFDDIPLSELLERGYIRNPKLAEVLSTNASVAEEFKKDLKQIYDKCTDYNGFVRELRGQRKYLTNITQIWTPYGERSAYNIYHVNKHTNMFMKDEHSTEMSLFNQNLLTNVNAVSKLNHKINIMHTFFERIKRPEGIFDNVEYGFEGLFRNYKDMYDTLEEMLKHIVAPNDGGNWYRAVQLNNFSTPEELEMLFSAMLNDPSVFHIIYDVMLNGKYTGALYNEDAIKDFINQTKVKFERGLTRFDNSFDTAKSIWTPNFLFEQDYYKDLDKELTQIHYVDEFGRKQTKEYDPIKDSSYMDILSRHDMLIDALNVQTSADTKVYAHNLLMSDITKLSRQADKLTNRGRALLHAQMNANLIDNVLNNMRMHKITSFIDNPESLLKHCLFEGGYVQFNIYRQSPISTKELRDAYEIALNTIFNNKAEYEKLGLEVLKTNRAVVVRLKKGIPWLVEKDSKGNYIATWGNKVYNYFTEDEIPKLYLKAVEEEGIYKDSVDVYNHVLERLYAHNSNFVGNGHMLTQEGMAYKMDNPEFKPIFNDWYDSAELEDRGFNLASKFDNTDMSIEAYQYHNMYSSGDAMANLTDAYKISVDSLEAYKLVKEVLYSGGFGMDLLNESGHYFAGLTDNEILKLINESSDLIPVAYLNKANGGLDMRAVRIHNVKTLNLARQAGVQLIPYDLYVKMFEEVTSNNSALPKILDNKLVKSVMLAYKTGYLMSPGAILRNEIDSNFKAMLDTGDPIGVIKNQIIARQRYVSYNKMISKMLEVYNNEPLTTTKILRFLRSNDKTYREARASLGKYMMDEDIFFNVKGFIDNGPSSGEASAILKYFKNKSKKEGNWGVYEQYLNSCGFALTGTRLVEQHVRYAQYLTYLEHGMVKSTANKAVERTAFNYAMKSSFDRLAEYVIPFYTFKKLNLVYWLREFSEHPAYFRNIEKLLNLTTQSFGDIDDNERIKNASLDYHIRNGNLCLDKNSGFTLKLNPSYMDMMNTFLDPMNTIQNSMFTPLQALLGNPSSPALLQSLFDKGYFYADGKSYFENTMQNLMSTQNLPFIGVLSQRYFQEDNPDTLTDESSTSKKNVKRLKGKPVEATLGKYFPDVFGATKRWEDFKYNNRSYANATLNYYNRYKSMSYTKPTNNVHYYQGRTYFRKYYPHRSKAMYRALRILNSDPRYVWKVGLY